MADTGWKTDWARDLPEGTKARYTPDPERMEKVKRIFTYHPPVGDQAERYTVIRARAMQFAMCLLVNCPESDELDHAIGCLSFSVMAANAAIARHED